MSIPSLNDFLIPFLEVLMDAQPHTRLEIRDCLALRFGLSEEDLKEKSGRQLTIQSRISWCDSHFVKAGFVEKEDAKDSSQDCFRITSVGQLQLQRHAKRITVAYLQSFYKGNIYRGAGSRDTTSDAELDLYQLLEKLPKPWVVFHSVGWIGQRDSKATVGEIDFLLAHPDWGLLLLEVKGGQISVEREKYQTVWYSRSRHGVLKEIKDPFGQVDRNKRRLSEYLQTNQNTKRFRYAVFGAVAFPDCQVDMDLRLDAPRDIVIDIRHLDSLEERLLEILRFWAAHADAANQQMDGQPAIDALVEALVPSRKLSARLVDSFERERRRIDKLTEQQFRILASLRMVRRAAIVGGAGTGKTVLAAEKSCQLAADGMRVLFLAFNRYIVESVSRMLSAEPNISVYTFHALTGRFQHLAGTHANRNMSDEEFMVKAPDLLFDAVQSIRKDGVEHLFDAIIVDEAQDFRDDMWLAIPELLRSPDGIFYVFFDDNQRLFTQLSNIPIEVAPFFLTENCRNTQRIHAMMMGYVGNSQEIENYCEGPIGRDVEIITADSKTVVRELQRLLHRLIHDNGVPGNEIVILTPRAQKNSLWKDGLVLGNFALTWDLQSKNTLSPKISTIFAFKGLEASVVILTELDKAPQDLLKQLVYVGLSRARHHAVILGDLPNLSG